MIGQQGKQLQKGKFSFIYAILKPAETKWGFPSNPKPTGFNIQSLT